mmetsp:Transcript_18620/g.25641  ORF Transcript_18620/g.25641 Transcript_18620/m.25641 type:complete len:147 (-) Transcript_18620:92-532(-)
MKPDRVSVGVPYFCGFEQVRGAKVHECHWNNGNVYIGQYEDGMMQGFGTLICTDGSSYTGTWKKGKFHGKAKRTFCNGEIYIGHYKDGMRHGHGTYYFKNNDVYEGEWMNNEINGNGAFHKCNDAKVYRGKFSHSSKSTDAITFQR